ncbi:hypothetical protein GQ54DRAFT_309047 [Martensiomyces pterosporus]|nr:hypothetical protein GQ54DRAFT_309047 [Martensiomyces pterosporus]
MEAVLTTTAALTAGAPPSSYTNANANVNDSAATPINPATLNEAQQRAYVSSLFPGVPLSPEEIRFVIGRETYKAKHRGHEGKHLAMFLIFVAVVALLPTTVKFWRRRHINSYRFVSIGSICLIPPYFALSNRYYRFISIWLAYAIANTYILYRATREPLHPNTPRSVYRWFAFINKASYTVFVLGFVMFALCFFNIIPGLTDTEYYIESSMLTVFYGLYFGLISRDLVTLCSDKMAATLGYSSNAGLPTKFLPQDVCCICGAGLEGSGSGSSGGLLSSEPEPAVLTPTIIHEPTHRLGCGHEFHASCIRGWCVVGKRDICPFCREKVDLDAFKQHPWDKQEMFYVAALEYMRFFISWQPMTLLLLAGVIGPEGPWHKACFKCKECQRRLDATIMAEHEQDVYCRNCHTRLFGPGASRRPVGETPANPASAPVPVNARPVPEYVTPSNESHAPSSGATPPPLPQRGPYQGSVTPSAGESPAAYRLPENPPRNRAFSSASQGSSVAMSRPTASATPPQTPPRSSYTGAGQVGFKRQSEVSPSSVFSSGRPKFNIPANKDICPRCSKPIYHAEKVVGPRGPWHRACFKCKQCSTALSSTIVTEHDGEAFCKNCYTKLFSPRGYNIGGSTEPIPPQSGPPYFRPRGASADSLDRLLLQPQSPTRTREIVAPTSATAMLPPSYPRSGTDSTTAISSGTSSPFSSTAAAAAASAAAAHQTAAPAAAAPLTGKIVSRPVSARSGISYGRAYHPKPFNTTIPADICPRCGDRIYAAELGIAAGRKYHKKCIKCKTCNTTINSLQITERESEIYCKQCYAKNFGPRGYRPSLGASINDY